MNSETSLDLDENNEDKKAKFFIEPIENLDDFFYTIFDENLNSNLKEDEFKKILCLNYSQIIKISDQRTKFLEDFDQIKGKLSQAHKKFSTLLVGRHKENSDSNEDVEVSSNSNESDSDSLDHKIDEYMDKKTQINKNDKNDNRSQSYFILIHILFH